MRKTSFYLTDEDADKLRRLAMRDGKSQSELIREGVRLVIAEVGTQPRVFRSMGAGHGGGARAPDWNADQLYRRSFREE
jgi:Arc/MetJ-type ribon-helix-helix transcriptional regulator